MHKRARLHSPIVEIGRTPTPKQIQSIFYNSVKVERLNYVLYRSELNGSYFLYLNNQVSLREDSIHHLSWSLVGCGKKKLKLLIAEMDLLEVKDETQSVQQLQLLYASLTRHNPLFPLTFHQQLSIENPEEIICIHYHIVEE